MRSAAWENRFERFGRAIQAGRAVASLMAALFAVGVSAAGAQQTGRIVGRVTATESGAPMGEVQVFIPGTGLGTLSRQNGAFVMLEVPAGPHEVRAERIGMAAVSQQVTVVAGQAAEVNFQMTTQALGLDEIVVTGTAGAARRREVGNTIAQINLADQPNRGNQSVELLQAAAPGIQVTKDSGVLGGGFNIRLRGNTTVSMSNQPIVYIDGIRMQSKPFPNGKAAAALTSGAGGGVQANPLNSINPNDIERMEVIKGSAATTLYGTEASAGVIQIFTKRGSSGAPVWNVESEHSFAHSMKIGPALFPYHRMDPYLSVGYVGNVALSLRGGAQALQYFASGGYDAGSGILPQDTISKWNVRGNFTFTPTPRLQLQWNTAYANTNQRNTPQGGNASGITHNAYRGFGNYFNTEDPKVVWQLFTQEIRQQIERFTTGGTSTYSPLANMTNRLTIGYDYSQQEVRSLRPFGFVFFTQGSIFNDTWQNRLLTFDYVGTYGFDVRSGVHSSFSWGGQAVGEDTRRLDAYGEGFPGAASPTVSSAATNVGEENRSKIWNAGFFFQNVFDISNRYFVTVGMRVDGNSTFGSGFGLQIYPKASASWVLSDESFWKPAWGSVKLRAAYGQSGRAPGAFDATRTWNSVPWGGNSAVVPGNLGNADIGPEVTAELEGGLDGEWLDSRVTVGLTYFRQITSHALFNVAQIPSTGFTNSQKMNVGKLRNAGIELSLNGSPVRSADWGLDLGLNLSTNHSKVVDLGGIPPFATGGGWIEEGLSVPAIRTRWVRNGEKPVAGNTGTAPVSGTTLALCTAANAVADPTLPCMDFNHVYGPAQPTLIVGPSMTVRMPGGVTLSARGEYRSGFYVTQSNFTDGGVSRSAWMPECWPYYVAPYDGMRQNPPFAPPTAANNVNLKPDTPAKYVAMCSVAYTNAGYSTILGDWFKLRSLSAQIPIDFAMPDRISNAAITLSLNNYFRWLNSQWAVGDPEMSTPVDGLTSGGAGSAPPPAWSFNASLRVQF